MRTLKFLIQKEFLQIFRNKSILPLIFVMPLFQLILLPFAANYEMKNISLSIVDEDKSSYSSKLINKFTSSGYFRLNDYSNDYTSALQQIEIDKSDLIVSIPKGFESDLIRDNNTKILLTANAVNGQTAGLAGTYASSIIKDFNTDIRVQMTGGQIESGLPISVTSSSWFNPKLSYKYFMVPGVLAMLVTLVGFILSSLNIVKEKEDGTIEQLNVTPIKKYDFILAKLIPFWVLGLMVMTVGLVVSRLIYGIVPMGNILVIYVYASLYLIAILGFGLLASTFSDTQQQAMFIAYFFMMIFVLLGGLFSPIENMPDWAKYLTYINPVSYFIEVIRMVVLKGSGFTDIKNHIFIMIGFAVFFNGFAVMHYKKRA